MPRKPLDAAVITRRTIANLRDAETAAKTLRRMIGGQDDYDAAVFADAVRKLESAGCQTRRAESRGQLSIGGS